MSWESALAAADDAVAATFDTEAFLAEAFVKPANASPNAPATADPDRLAFEFSGSIDFEPSINAFGQASRRSPDDLQPRQVSQIAISALTAGWPWVPVKGTRITRLSDETVYNVVLPDGDGTDRKVFWVNRGR